MFMLHGNLKWKQRIVFAKNQIVNNYGENDRFMFINYVLDMIVLFN